MSRKKTMYFSLYPINNLEKIILIEGKDLVLKDLREKKAKYRIKKIHDLSPTDVSVNPNKTTTVITGGKDAL